MTSTMHSDRAPRFNEGFAAGYVRNALAAYGYNSAISHTDDLTRPATVTFRVALPDGEQLEIELTVHQRTEQDDITDDLRRARIAHLKAELAGDVEPEREVVDLVGALRASVEAAKARREAGR